MRVLLRTHSGGEIMPADLPVPRWLPRFCRFWLPQDARVCAPPTSDRENEHADSGEPNITVLQTLVPMVVEGGPMK